MPLLATSTYVAIERTPRESAASGTTFMGGLDASPDTSDASAAIHLEDRARHHRRVVGAEEQGRARDVLRRVQPAEGNGVDERLAPGVVDLRLAHECRQHRGVRG